MQIFLLEQSKYLFLNKVFNQERQSIVDTKIISTNSKQIPIQMINRNNYYLKDIHRDMKNKQHNTVKK